MEKQRLMQRVTRAIRELLLIQQQRFKALLSRNADFAPLRHPSGNGEFQESGCG